MNINKILPHKNIIMNMVSETKTEAIEEMVDCLVASGKIRDRKAAIAAILDREKKMSTGMQHGIAVPHGKTDTVDELVAAIALKAEGIDFDSIDGQPSTIFIMTLSPLNRAGPHIQFLAEMSQLLNDAERRRAVLQSRNPRELMEALVL